MNTASLLGHQAFVCNYQTKQIKYDWIVLEKIKNQDYSTEGTKPTRWCQRKFEHRKNSNMRRTHLDQDKKFVP